MVTEYDLHQYEGERFEGHHLGLFWIGETIPFLMRIGRIGSIRYSAGDIRNKNDSLFLRTHTKRPPEVGFAATGNRHFAEYRRLCRVYFIGHSAKTVFAEC